VPLYLNNGVLLVRGGGLAADAACCCEPPCEYRYICAETVYSTYQGSINSETGPNGEDNSLRDTIPAQPAGVIRVTGRKKVGGEWFGWSGCPNAADGVEQERGSLPPAACCPQPDENWDETTMWTIRQQYHRLRVVDSCDECVSSLSYTCDGNCLVGVQATGCVNFSAYTPPQSTQMQACADALGVDLCAPPPPACESSCYWVNYQTYPSQLPAEGGWYLYASYCTGDCGCSDPSAACGAAPPESEYGECVSPCNQNPFP
jgi:hypothetical protein